MSIIYKLRLGFPGRLISDENKVEDPKHMWQMNKAVSAETQAKRQTGR